jgi:hypothetical protein
MLGQNRESSGAKGRESFVLYMPVCPILKKEYQNYQPLEISQRHHFSFVIFT